MKRDPVFIVGVQRSGTTLVAAMLAGHSKLSCGPETHFFRRLAKQDTHELVEPGNWPRPALRFICSIKHSGFDDCESMHLIEKYELERDQIESYLEGCDPGVPGIIASVTEQFMKREGKTRWVEKTPDHIEYLHSIRRHFPASPIIRMIRDPRDVALSLTRVPWGAKSFMEGVLYWKRLDDVSAPFFAADDLCHTLRFEDLLENPSESLEGLCEFIGEEFEPQMLDTGSAGKKINSRSVPWKAKASEPLDASRSCAWRRELRRDENRLVEGIVGDRLDAYGYSRDETFTQFGEVFPAEPLSAKYSSGLEVVAAAGVRFWRSSPEEKTTTRVYLGDPERNHWLADGGFAKISGLLATVSGILFARLLGRSVYWVPDEGAGHWPGYTAALLKKLLGSARVDNEGRIPSSKVDAHT